MLVELNEKEVEMITAFRRIFMNENEVIVVDHINRDNYKHYIGKTVKVTGNVDLRGLGLTKIPINFTEVGGDFDFHNNDLTSLKGAPTKVGRDFYCSYNKLTSLVCSPNEVSGFFNCSDNELTTLKGGPIKVGINMILYIKHKL